MKNLSIISSIIIIILFQSCVGLTGGNGVQIENSEFIKTFICDRNKPGIIQPEYYRKTDGKILNLRDAPYFEFIINGKITTLE